MYRGFGERTTPGVPSFPPAEAAESPGGAWHRRGKDIVICAVSQSIPEHWHSRGAGADPRSDPALLFIAFSFSCLTAHTTLSSSLMRKRKVNHSAHTAVLDFWSISEDLMETLPCFYPVQLRRLVITPT